MVGIETPFETPARPTVQRSRVRPRVEPPSHPPSAIDRVPFRADPAKRVFANSVRPPPPKAFSGLLFLYHVRDYDRLISRLIAEYSRG